LQYSTIFFYINKEYLIVVNNILLHFLPGAGFEPLTSGLGVEYSTNLLMLLNNIPCY
jgi:hypothetical protein